MLFRSVSVTRGAETFKRIAENLTVSEQVRKEMSQKGLVMPNGQKISKTHFYRLLRNKVYAGWIIKFGECHKGLFEPIITDELFEQVQLVLKYKRRRDYTYKVKHPDFPLRRFITHPSGRKLTGCWSKGKSKYYAYYLFKIKNLIFRKETLEQKFVAFLNQHRLKEEHFKR